MNPSSVTPAHLAALRAAVEALGKEPDADRVRCFYCTAEATVLCDGVLGFRRVWERAGKGRWCIDRDHEDPIVTCDRPLCAACATRAGVAFFCGADPAAGIDTTDYCQDCARDAHRPTLARPKTDILPGDEELEARRRRRMLRATGDYDSLRDFAAPLADLLRALEVE